ncbi:ParB/RepB/Spo0J family partition protein [Tolypothrix sp. FACHB-123]|uniref:ParB/RepB/Spo0J family partition protein n=1 Tax=Tolypothrix sp. FACHB-123 TaxID=2692868 RepID=UPI0016843983|nr:ParB/RepB/Spo0J family partition protein [Tolypothrix sp. FACHB-123]MBD2358150.1 ParB/RepB/Spo0J family partition protein [Tolypothrix sp. FACHB-123]
MPRKTQNKNYDYFSANVQAAEIESQLVQSQQRIAELESLNAQLQSLFSSSNVKSDNAQLTVEIDKIICNKEQVRRYFDPDKLATLTASIKEVGVRSPLWVRPYSDDKYLLIAGERRYRAAQDAGLTEVPVVIVEVDETSALKLSLLENLQREDLNPVEETEGILHLLSIQLDCTTQEVVALLNRKAHLDKQKVESSDEDTENVFRKQWSVVENVFTTVGKLSPESFRVSRLPLLNMPTDVLEVLRSGQMEYTKARVIATVKDEVIRANLLAEAIALKLSLAQIRDRIKEAKPQEPPSLKQEFQNISRQILKSYHWEDPKKAKNITNLLQKLKALLTD